MIFNFWNGTCQTKVILLLIFVIEKRTMITVIFSLMMVLSALKKKLLMTWAQLLYFFHCVHCLYGVLYMYSKINVWKSILDDHNHVMKVSFFITKQKTVAWLKITRNRWVTWQKNKQKFANICSVFMNLGNAKN